MLPAAILAWMAVAGCATLGTFLYQRGARHRLTTPETGGVAIIVPVKGGSGLTPFLAAITGQAGIGYRLIFAVESEADPAAARLRAQAATDPRISVVVAGRAEARGQKIHNQLAGLAALRADDAIVVFADADTRPPADWLAQLIRPVALGRADIASGYRWILPDDGRLASRLAALMDWTIATAPRDRRWNICWGGSIAVSRGALGRLDLARLWSGALLDDLTLTRAGRRAGLRIHAPRRVLMPSPVRHDFWSLADFARRQYLLVRIHAPRHWWLAGVTLAVPVMGAAAAIPAAFSGNVPAIAWLLAALALQQYRARLRLRVVRAVLPAWCADRTAAVLKRDLWLLPLAHLLHLGLFLTSAFGRTMTWGGIRYRIDAPDRVAILHRTAANHP